MAEASWPSPDNGRVVDEIQYEQMCMHYTEDGLYMHPDGQYLDLVGGPVYSDGSGLVVKVRANQLGNVRGFGWSSGDTDISLAIAANASGATRIDRVVLELDRSTWNVRAKVVQGTAGAGIPALTRNEGPTGKFQVHIARVTVPNNATSIPANNVYVDGLRIGSRVRVHLGVQEMFNSFPKMGELGFDYARRSWMGFTGNSIRDIGYSSGKIPLAINGRNRAAWSANDLNYVQEESGIIRARIAIKRWDDNGLSTSDDTGSEPIVLPADFRPSNREPGFAYFVNGNGGPVGLRAEQDGVLRVYAIGHSIPAGATVFGEVTWFRYG